MYYIMRGFPIYICQATMPVLLILLLLPVCCFSQSISRVDRFLSKPADINHELYFDSLLQVHPTSDYVIGMSATFTAEQNVVKAKSLLDNKINKDKVRQGSYIKMAQAVVAHKSNQVELAKQHFAEALALDVDSTNKWLRLHLFNFYEDNNRIEADKYLNKALSIDSTFYDALLARVTSYDQASECRRAINAAHQLRRIYRNDYKANYLLGEAYLNCGHIKQAEGAFHNSIKNKANAESFIGLGEVERKHKNNTKYARDFYKYALEINESPEALAGLGWCAFDEKEHDRAESYFSNAIQSGRKQELYNEFVFFYIKRKDFIKAQNLNKEAKKIFGTNEYNDGYQLFFDIEINKIKSKEASLILYRNQYGGHAAKWLVSILNTSL
jgi:tetratricopeptide (TPR) repeat protein